MFYIKKFRWLLIIVLTYMLIQLIGSQTTFINTYYYSNFYIKLSVKLRALTESTPISIGDCLYGIVLIYIVYKSFFIRKNWKKDKWLVINSICKGLLIFMILFNVCWGFNYYRTPLYERLYFGNTYSENELIQVTQILTQRTNLLHETYTKDKGLRITVPQEINNIYLQAAKGYVKLGEMYPEFIYKNTNVKTSLFSYPLTYMGFSGYLNPFTNEAQVNANIPKINLFVTASHEIAHQIGIGPEAEANFVGYLAAKNNPEILFKYAASNFALRYCLSRYPFKNETEFKNYLKKINPGILEEWKVNKEFWESHQTFIDTFFKYVYDKFLKVNQQEFGIEGYSRFLDLLIHYELNKKKDEL